MPDELPRIHEAFAPLPPKDWRLLLSVAFPMSEPAKAKARSGLATDRALRRISPGGGKIRLSANRDAQELPQQAGAVKGEFVAAAVIGKSEQFRDLLRSA